MPDYRYQLAAIDLDGTLLNSRDHDISSGNAAQVRRVRAAGAHVVLASGRPFHTMANFALQLELPPESPMIAYNGALTRTVAGETLSHRPLPAAAAARIVHYCAARDHHLNYYLNDEWYVREETHWSKLYQERTRSVPRVTHDLTQFDGERPTKLLLIDTPDATDALLKKFQSDFGDSLYITKTEDEYLEFMQAGVSKGVALAKAAEDLGITQDRCVAFGDSFNDIPMLEWAGLGIAMDNAKPAIKAAADRVAPPANDDGVGTLLAELFP